MSQVRARHFALGPSRIFAGILAVAHATSLIALWWSSLALPALVLVTVLVSGHGLWAIWRFALLRSPRSITAITVDGQSRCTLIARDGVIEQAELAAQTTVTGRMVLIVARIADARRFAALRHVAIFSDTLELAAFREMRVRVKWARPQTRAPSHSRTSMI
ncbi:MAG: hypothetical protein ABJB04_00090 [Betaproteobacteria bacterium]